MINEHYLNMLSNKSVIRTLSEYATARGKEVGYENVFDFSLGNPSVPAPQSFKDVSISLLETMEPLKLHGYSPTLGIPEVKEKVAASLNRRFGMNYTGNHIFATSGAAGALAHALRAVTKPGDEVLVFAPYFPEYNPYINDTGARIKVVPADLETFQINFAEAEKYLTENVAAVLINTPNNPSGVLYSEETLEKLADLLTRKSMCSLFPMSLTGRSSSTAKKRRMLRSSIPTRLPAIPSQNPSPCPESVSATWQSILPASMPKTWSPCSDRSQEASATTARPR